jgi:hypothetical protein
MKPTKMPEKPWAFVSADFFGPTDGGWYWFINIDDHSNWAWVDKIRATDEDNVEKVLDRLFSMFGAPEVYKTDNGSPFQSHRFKAYIERWGCKHRKVTPEWPRANGKAESFMKKLGKVLKTSKISGQDEQEALREFLRRYNDTPHSTTGVSPNQLLFGFSRSSGIPNMVPETPEQREKFRQEALANDARAKKRMEQEYNHRMRAREPTIAVGDSVLIKLKKRRKATASWDVNEPYTVIAVRGSMITAARSDREITRNSSAFKLFRQKELSLRHQRGGKRLRRRAPSNRVKPGKQVTSFTRPTMSRNESSRPCQRPAYQKRARSEDGRQRRSQRDVARSRKPPSQRDALRCRP